MGLGSWQHWLILLLIVVLIFGTKKLKNIGSDLGSAVKGFKESMKESEVEEPVATAQQAAEPEKLNAPATAAAPAASQTAAADTPKQCDQA